MYIVMYLSSFAVVNITIVNKSKTEIHLEQGTLSPGEWTEKPPQDVGTTKTVTCAVRTDT